MEGRCDILMLFFRLSIYAASVVVCIRWSPCMFKKDGWEGKRRVSHGVILGARVCGVDDIVFLSLPS